jgi:hypothetical protein
VDDKAKAIARLSVIADTIDERPAAIRAARALGATWEAIADSLRMSRQAVINLSKK